MKARLLWDEGTKKRLIEAAGEVFAQRGFKAATIRAVCKQANAGVSAVHYHFGDKEGLYEELFQYSHRWAVEKYPHDWGLGAEATAEERLQAFIRSFLLRGLGDGFPAWHGRLLAQETANPSGVLSKIMEAIIRPMDEYLEGIIGDLFRKEDPSREPEIHFVRLCRMNVVGQCIFQIHAGQFIQAPGDRSMDRPQIIALADQITRFSLGGIRTIAIERPGTGAK